ncbi:MAG: endonuclease/exonuclease/phosphatase family metal-dependent hydrolase [Verrucomicrobiales bacterium]|jgi:endonuclease/exonuclease/phosphatase family metal-dependent hydrolase
MSNTTKSLVPALLLLIIGAAGLLLTYEKEPIDVSIVTYNIRLLTDDDKGTSNWEERKDLVADTIRDEDADFVCVQEAYREQLDHIGSRVGTYSELGVGREDGAALGEYSAILYKTHRFNVIDSGTFWLSSQPDEVNSMTWGNKVTRICTWARFEEKESGRMLDVFNAHFDHQSEDARRRSMAQIVRRISERPQPRGHIILTGDFNAGEKSWAFRYVTGAPDVEALVDDPSTDDIDPVEGQAPLVLRDTFRAIHPDAKEPGTFHGFSGNAGNRKIDHIFVGFGSNHVLKADVWRVNRSGQYPSDHFPVRATVRFW